MQSSLYIVWHCSLYGTCLWDGGRFRKPDIKSAFRLLPIHPEDIPLLGFAFEGKFYMDRVLPRGCSVSCLAFETFSSFLEWALKHGAGLAQVVHYLDDFFCFVGDRAPPNAGALWMPFGSSLRNLVFLWRKKKTEGLCPVLTFWGKELDTARQSSRLPESKITDLTQRLKAMLEQHKV